MRIDIITCAPSPLRPLFGYGIVKRAIEKKLASVHVHNLRDYGIGQYKKIDDAPYGGEAGMVLMLEPIVRCIENLQKERAYDEIIYLAPEGEAFSQSMANRLSLCRNIILLCGHYKGIDERICDCVDLRKVSIGDYILPGGELPAAIIAQSIIRLLPGALSDETSALNDSFQDGLIAAPVYTRPAVFRGLAVPPVLKSGNQRLIQEWKEQQREDRT
ncbi:MAG: tRNA (guanosine(37)-N1)-methyltransferase TrmD, partial [Bacteroidota bacterium]